jgi:hypothetical protein
MRSRIAITFLMVGLLLSLGAASTCLGAGGGPKPCECEDRADTIIQSACCCHIDAATSTSLPLVTDRVPARAPWKHGSKIAVLGAIGFEIASSRIPASGRMGIRPSFHRADPVPLYLKNVTFLR